MASLLQKLVQALVSQRMTKLVHIFLSGLADLCFIAGSVPFIEGSWVADENSQRYFYNTAINFLVGSILFLAGSAFILLDGLWTMVSRHNFGLTSWTDLLAGILYTVGGILFTLGAIFFLSRHNPTAVVVWTVGASFFMGGATAQLLSDQTDMLILNPTTANLRTKLGSWLATFGTDWYFVGAVLFLVGACIFDPNLSSLNFTGNILWVIGSFTFIIGGLCSIASLFLE
jgi:hypothetical protein